MKGSEPGCSTETRARALLTNAGSPTPEYAAISLALRTDLHRAQRENDARRGERGS